MTPEQQRIAIAEACGWKMHDHPDCLAKKEGWVSRDWETWVMNPSGILVFKHDIPDYLNDLNAMHEAEKVLTEKGVNAWWAYVAHINRNNPTPFRAESAVHATAAQRAEAFLRTLNLFHPPCPPTNPS
jgi:hypothetical protein